MFAHGFASRRSQLVLGACLAAIALSGCQKQQEQQATSAAPIAALAPVTSAPATPVAYAPAANALPPAPAPITYRPARQRSYGYVDSAYAMNRAFGDTPPDYQVEYDGTQPWVWRSDDGAYRVAEQLPRGERYYYYRPGARYPFYVADPDGGYAYDNGELVGVYGPRGDVLSGPSADERAAMAARYYARSGGLYQSAVHQERHAAYASQWQARHDALAQQQEAWNAQRNQDAQWAAWHDAHQQQEQQHWQGERDRRSEYAAALGAAVVGTATILALGHQHDHDNNQRQPVQPLARPQPPQNPGTMRPGYANGAVPGEQPRQWSNPGAPPPMKWTISNLSPSSTATWP